MQADPIPSNGNTPLFLWKASRGGKTIYLLGAHKGVSDFPEKLGKVLEKVERVYFDVKINFWITFRVGFKCGAALKQIAGLDEVRNLSDEKRQECISQITSVVENVFKHEFDSGPLRSLIDKNVPPCMVAYNILTPLLENVASSDQNMATALANACKSKKIKIDGLLKGKQFSDFQMNQMIHAVGKIHQTMMKGTLERHMQVLHHYHRDFKEAYQQGDLDRIKEMQTNIEQLDIFDIANLQRSYADLVRAIERIRKQRALVVANISCFVGSDNILELLPKRGWTIKRL